MSQTLTEPAKLLLLIALLSKDRIISNNGKGFIKDLILRRDPRLKSLIEKFERKETNDMSFLEQVHDLIADEASSMYNDLFCDTSLEIGKALSKNERERKHLNEEKSLIYGEVEFASFYRVLRKINPPPGLVFYDLGSGTGKALFVARLTQDFSKCIGVEILHSLHTQASLIVNRYNSEYKPLLALGQSQYTNVFEGSFTDFDWSNGDVVFANSTCFSDELMADLSVQAEKLKPGAIVVTFTKGMTSKAFEVLERKRYKMSWGPATVYIHRRLNPDGTPVGPARLNILPSDAMDYDNEYPVENIYTTNKFASSASMDEEDDTSYDDDIDYDIRQTEDEEDDGEDDENAEEGDDEGDEEENGLDEEDYEEDEERESEDGDESPIPKVSPTKISPEKTSLANNSGSKPTAALHITSPKSPNLSLRSPSSANPDSSSKNVDSANKPSDSANLNKSPKNKTTPAKIYPMAAHSPEASPKIEKPTQDSIASDFNSLNSPFDSALLMRKRKENFHHETPSAPPNDFNMLNSPFDSALLMRKRSAHNSASKTPE